MENKIEVVKPLEEERRFCQPIAYSLLFGVAVVCTLVLLGWLFDNPYLTSWNPNFFPMTIKSAVMSLLLAGALAAYMSRKPNLFFWIVLLVLVGASLTLADAVSSRLWGGTTQILSGSGERGSGLSVHHFRLPTTLFSAVCFFFLSLSLLFLYLYRESPSLIWVAGACNLLAFFPEVVSLGNVVSGSYARNMVSMPLNGALTLLALTVATALVIGCTVSISRRQRLYYNALNTFGLVMGLVLVLVINWIEKSRTNIQNWLELDTQYITLLLQEELLDQVQSDRRFVARLMLFTEAQQKEPFFLRFLEEDAKNYLVDKQGLEAIHIFSDKERDTYFFSDPGLSDAYLADVRSLQSAAPPEGRGFYMVRVPEKEHYFLVFQERWREGDHTHTAQFIYNPRDIGDALHDSNNSRKQLSQVSLKITINGVPIYEKNRETATTLTVFTSTFTFQHLQVSITVAPDFRFVLPLLGIFPSIIFLGAGIFLALLTSYMIFLFYQFRETNRELQVANQAKTIFLANVSHEIRTPLHGIIGSGSLLEESMEEDSKQKKQLQRMMISARYLLDLVNNLLDMTKYESHSLPVVVTWCDIEQVTRDQIEILTQQAKIKGLTLYFDFTTDGGSCIQFADHIWKQVVMNLVGNALKFTDVGSISVHVRLTHKSAEEGELFLSVKDTGIGIPEDKINLLFNKFSRIEQKGTVRGGTGLGLYLTKLFVEKLGGKVTVTSEPGVGTTFIVVVPILFTKPKEDKAP